MYFANCANGQNKDEENIGEIKRFYESRYLSACVASWRIFAYDVHYRVPAVMRLLFHLPVSVFELCMKCNKYNEDSRQLLDIGEGKVGGPKDGKAKIEIPDTDYFQKRVFFAPTNEIVSELNDRLIESFPGEPVEYLSSNSLSKYDYIDGNVDPTLYSTKLLNGLKIPRLPNYQLILKVGVPVMLLKNIDQQKGLCNGTRLQVVSLGAWLIEVKILYKINADETISIPRIALTLSDKNMAFKFTRQQYPLSVCFAMNVNKSQGQLLSRVGLYLRNDVFSHGQLYVALSRVTSKEGLKILILDKNEEQTNKTTNVVFKEIFSYLN
ncbi:uncharacterized protein LOC143594905 [Bidens hawaiensis]|uniref:uncharacterized protein LOC143594905 n=1 Tax=Bidens hawaiensis TaxID=980011 RepID=UPI004049F778